MLLLKSSIVAALLAATWPGEAAACGDPRECAHRAHCLESHSHGFPIVIDKAGSYRLCRNLTVPTADTTAILVTASDVTIDLGGFSIAGPTVCDGSSCSPSGEGKGVSAARISNLTVRNGTIRGMGSNGLEAGANARVEGVRVIGNGRHGIAVGTTCSLVGNLATRNGENGISGQEYCLVKDNVAHDNGSDGISAGCACSVVGNVATNNARSGIVTGGWTACISNTAAGNVDQQLAGCSAVPGSNVCNYAVCP